MPAPRRIGISYARFSDPKQAHGDSEGRQDRDYRDFCQRHSLTPLTEVFLDRGRSGYKDEHRKKGRLGVLIQYAKDGQFEPQSVIVIEAWDRLGRLRPDKQTDLIAELLRTGVDIGVCQLNDIFTESDFGTHKWIVLSTFIMLAYQESKQKGERIAASYQSRRERARAGKPMPPRKTDGRVSRLITDRLPYWLEAVNGEPRGVPERVAAVQRIFELAAEGLGRARIVAALIAEGVPSFGKGKTWTRSYVNKILNDRRVLGEYQPRHTDDTTDGAALKGYYPAVVSEKQWLLSRAGQEQRRGKDRLGRALVRSERKHVNLFRSLLVSALDSEGFFLHLKVDGDKRRHVLANLAGVSGRARAQTFPYASFEEAVLTLLHEVNPAEVLPSPGRAASTADVLRAKLANVRQDLAGLQADLKTGYSKALAAVLRDREAEEEQLAGQLQEELSRQARPASKAWKDLPGLVDLVRKGGDEARLRLRPVLRRIIDVIHMLVVRRRSYLVAALQVHFAEGGKRRHYLIVNQSASRNCKGGWWARSFADAALPGDLDLRRPADAAKLEAVLQAVRVER
jgi:DNA invertase Pin-like site-specific DNA recombinase